MQFSNIEIKFVGLRTEYGLKGPISEYKDFVLSHITSMVNSMDVKGKTPGRQLCFYIQLPILLRWCLY